MFFIATADAILAEAESKAQTAEIKQRIATCRLPIWKLKLLSNSTKCTG